MTATPSPFLDKGILFVRITFIVGALFDVLFVPPLIHPRLAGLLVLHMDGYNPDAMTTYMMHAGAALMAGWAGILFWAAADPVERRWIIPITLFPLLSGLFAAGVRFYAAGGTTLQNMMPLLLVSVVLFVAQAFGYFITRRAAAQARGSSGALVGSR